MPDSRLPRGSDDGAPDAHLAAALQAWAGRPDAAERAEVLASLGTARVFLALAARPTGTEVSETTGLVQERTAEMSLLSVVAADGARALPVFSDGHAVQRWRAEARPVPVPGRLACLTALDDGAEAVLLDPPTSGFVVAAAEVGALAAGRVPVPGSAVSTRRASASLTAPAAAAAPSLVEALRDALEDEPVCGARLLDGPDGPVLGVVPAGPVTAADLAALADRVARRLGPRLPPAGLDLAAVTAEGPGQPVLVRTALRRRWWRR